ncbi:MAG: DUF3656 domain-containing protein [Huintestinicola sp.]
MESVYAAVRCGADGVYVGGKDFSARANAVNFSYDELKAAADYCHLHGVRIYRAMNTVIFDSECESFFNEVKASAKAGIDGLIIQDIGGAGIAAAAVPDMPRHASTQMTISTAGGAEAAKKLGFCRVVPARELTLSEIRDICGTSIETEVFVHGAQCMCLSGQCYMSAVIGSRSSNRGRCAQACRLPFSCSTKRREERYDLSLKDMSLVSHVKELADAGAASFKIEGRMKRPEYTAAAVTALRHALDGNTDPKDTDRLEAVFSRSGFTDGYLTGNTGTEMFGFRRKEDVISANSVLSELAELYRYEKKTGSIDFHFTAKASAPARLEYEVCGITGCIEGKIPEAAVNRMLTAADIEKQLTKLGDTIFTAGRITCDIDEGIMLPASEINRMRREAASEAEGMIRLSDTPVYDTRENLPELPEDRPHSGRLQMRIRSDKFRNIASLAEKCDLLILPIEECEKLCDSDHAYKDKTAAYLPMFVSDEERLIERVKKLRDKGITHFYCDCFTHLGTLMSVKGITIHGGSGMNITNSYAMAELEKLGFADAVVSFEMKAGQISALKKPIPTGIFAYGRLPLMTVKNCPIKASEGCGKCTHSITDRTGRVFPVRCCKDHAVILNCDILETAGQLDSFKGIGFCLLDMSGVTEKTAEDVLSRYERNIKPSGSFTRGLYTRGII